MGISATRTALGQGRPYSSAPVHPLPASRNKEQLTIAQAEMALTSRQLLINVDGAYVAAVSGVAVGSAGLFALRKRKCGGILANLDGVYAQMDASRRLMKELNSVLFQEEAPDRPL